jgi:hypothetical protein
MVALALVVSLPVFASAERVTFVPWKVLEPGAQPDKKAFVLFWIPASPDEMRRSDLITSERLALYAGRCIGMHVVRVDDRPMLVKLGADESLPMALLTEGDKEIARLTTESGPLSALRVEAMVRAAFDLRENALNALLDRASEKV